MQAALLAGLPQAPSLYDPFLYPQAALARRNEVLDAMLDDRRDHARASTSARIRDTSLRLKPGTALPAHPRAVLLLLRRDELIATYGAQTVRSGGLSVYTTIDPAFQRAAQKAITDTLYLKDDPAAAVVSINPANGAIRAMTAVYPGPHEEPVQPRLPRRAARRGRPSRRSC